MRIVLLGAPGSGKGTQAKKLMAERSIPQISTGDILREAVASGSDFGKEASKIMDGGGLVPDALMLDIINDRLGKSDTKMGFILDGFPRTKQQAIDLDNLLEKRVAPLESVILIDVDFEFLMKRLTGRRTCSITGRLLNIHFSSQQEIDECIENGGYLIHREDDNEETISSRLEVYRKQTEPLIKFYSKKNKLKMINGLGTIDEVYNRFINALE